MKKILFPLLLLATLSACNSENKEVTSQNYEENDLIESTPRLAENHTEKSLSETAGEWGEKTKELGKVTWDESKNLASAAAEKSKDIYEAVKEKTGAVTESSTGYLQTAKEKTTEIVSTVADKTKETFEIAKERTVKAIDSLKGE